MKKSSWVDELSKATKGTMVVCGILLVVAAVAVMILMFFPIQKEDRPTIVVEPTRHTEFSATTHATTARTSHTTTTSHTLSTWNAGVHGFNPDVNEHLGTVGPRYSTMDPRLERKETTTLREGQTMPQTTLGEGEIPFIMPTTTRPETTTMTVTETESGVDAPAETQETQELTAPPLPVEVQ